MLTKLKSVIEKAMTNKVESDNSRVKFMQMLSGLEDFMASDLNQTNYKMRSDQRVLEKYSEVTQSDSHWRTFETFDDFVIDQLSDCTAYFDTFVEQEKLK